MGFKIPPVVSTIFLVSKCFKILVYKILHKLQIQKCFGQGGGVKSSRLLSQSSNQSNCSSICIRYLVEAAHTRLLYSFHRQVGSEKKHKNVQTEKLPFVDKLYKCILQLGYTTDFKSSRRSEYIGQS